MILNKIRSLCSAPYLCVLSPKLFALSLIFVFSCNKSADINGNKAFVSFTHYAYNVNPLTLEINGDTVFSAIPFDSATGYPYVTVTSQISNTSIFEQNNVDTFLTGFSSFRQGAYYSIYIYDTLNALGANSKSMIILQDNPPLNSDTTVSIRYMNFSPSPFGLLLVNTRADSLAIDTVSFFPESFVGYNPNPAAYTFQTLLAGNYNIFAYLDSARPTSDSSNFRYLGNYPISVLYNYNFNLLGFTNVDTGLYKLQLKTVPLN